MKLSERFLKIRMDTKMSRDEFGAKLGVSRDVIANIELERVEPKPLFTDLLCDVFHVNKDWLLYGGEGEPYIKSTDDSFNQFCAEHNITGDERKIIELHLQLPMEIHDSVVEAIRRIGQGLEPIMFATAARTKTGEEAETEPREIPLIDPELDDGDDI